MTYYIEAGILYRPDVRRLLTVLKFEQQVEAFEESKAWHGSTFLIRGYTPLAERRLDALVASIEAEQERQEAERQAEQADSDGEMKWAIITILVIVAAFVGAHLIFTS